MTIDLCQIPETILSQVQKRLESSGTSDIHKEEV